MTTLQRWAAGVLILLVVLAGVFGAGWWSHGYAGEVDRLEQQNAAVVEALRVERKAAALSQKLAVAEQGRADARAVQTVYVTKEVTKYVEREKAAAAAGRDVVWLDAEWVHGHDAAASPPGTSSISDGEAGPASAGDTLATITGNYAQCYRWRDQVIGWQEWWGSVE